MMIDLLAPNELAVPGVVKVRVASFNPISLIVPPDSIKAVVLV